MGVRVWFQTSQRQRWRIEEGPGSINRMFPIWKLNRMIYLPACRFCARHAMTGSSPDGFMQFLSRVEFLMVHHYWPNFNKPRTFSEKLWRRMLFDRDPRYVLISDKVRVRSYIENTAGHEYLVPLLWSGANPDAIPWEKLPSAFAIKATHGCGYNLLIREESALDVNSARLQLRKWLQKNYGKTFGMGIEWCYRHIPPFLIIESFLEDDGRGPWDYKFWCFSGRAECLTIHKSRHEKHVVQTFDRDFNPYPFPFPLGESVRDFRPPSGYQDMVRVAERLSRGFDFLRIDMYNVGGRVFVGELTVYPGGGFMRYLPRQLEESLGAKWPEGPQRSGVSSC
jgi:hypothetical protein